MTNDLRMKHGPSVDPESYMRNNLRVSLRYSVHVIRIKCLFFKLHNPQFIEKVTICK